MSKLRGLVLDKLPKGSTLTVRILAASTGAFRLRLYVTRPVPGHAEPVEVELEDAAMRQEDVLLDLQRFAAENLAILAARKLDAGAGKSM